MPFGTTHLNRDRARRGTASAMVRGEGHFPVPRPILSVAKGNREGVREARSLRTLAGLPRRPSGADREMVSKGRLILGVDWPESAFGSQARKARTLPSSGTLDKQSHEVPLHLPESGAASSMLRRFDNKRWNSPGRSALQQCYFRLGERYEQYNMVGRCYRDHPCNSRILWVPLGLHKAM